LLDRSPLQLSPFSEAGEVFLAILASLVHQAKPGLIL